MQLETTHTTNGIKLVIQNAKLEPKLNGQLFGYIRCVSGTWEVIVETGIVQARELPWSSRPSAEYYALALAIEYEQAIDMLRD